MYGRISRIELASFEASYGTFKKRYEQRLGRKYKTYRTISITYRIRYCIGEI